jgi:protein-disulfide isomerase
MSKEEKKKQEEVVINLDSFAVPLAIVIAGVIIAGAVFFTNKDKDSSNVAGSDTTTGTDSNPGETYPSVSTTIDDDPYIGNKDSAKVAIVEFTDYQCPYCFRHIEEVYPDIVKDYVDTGKIIYVFRDFPLSFHGQIAIDSANAAQCVYEISGTDTFSKYHDQIFEVADASVLSDKARELGVDMTKFTACMTENRYKDDIDADIADGSKAGVTGTPGFVIGVLKDDGTVEGKRVDGAYPYDTFKTILDEMLAK